MRAALPYGILWMPRAGLDPRLPDQLLLLAFLLHICGRNCMPQEMLVPWISLASSFVCPVCPVIVMAICNFCSWKSLYQRWNSSRQVLFFSRDEMRTRNWTSTNVHTILFQGIPQYIVQNLVRKDCSCRSKGIWSDNDLSATVWELRTFCFSESTWSIQVNWPFWSQLIGVPGYSGVPLITHAVWTLKIPRIRAPLKEIPEAMLPDARFDEAFEDKSGEKDAKGPDHSLAIRCDPLLDLDDWAMWFRLVHLISFDVFVRPIEIIETSMKLFQRSECGLNMYDYVSTERTHGGVWCSVDMCECPLPCRNFGILPDSSVTRAMRDAESDDAGALKEP